jgi:hypothetical protein
VLSYNKLCAHLAQQQYTVPHEVPLTVRHVVPRAIPRAVSHTVSHSHPCAAARQRSGLPSKTVQVLHRGGGHWHIRPQYLPYSVCVGRPTAAI